MVDSLKINQSKLQVTRLAIIVGIAFSLTAESYGTEWSPAKLKKKTSIHKEPNELSAVILTVPEESMALVHSNQRNEYYYVFYEDGNKGEKLGWVSADNVQHLNRRHPKAQGKKWFRMPNLGYSSITYLQDKVDPYAMTALTPNSLLISSLDLILTWQPMFFHTLSIE